MMQGKFVRQVRAEIARHVCHRSGIQIWEAMFFVKYFLATPIF